MRSIAILLSTGMFAFSSFAQTKMTYGIEMKINAATQLSTNPSKPEDGTFQNDQLACYGVNGYFNYHRNNHWSFTSKLGYLQNGFQVNYQTSGSIGSSTTTGGSTITEIPPNVNVNEKNKYHYIFSDLLARYSFGHGIIRPNVFGGLRPKFLAAKNIQSQAMFADTTTTGSNFYYGYNEYKRFALGYVVGVGVQINRLMNIELETNPDITNSVSNRIVKARNWIWGGSIGINISEICVKKES